MFRLQHAQIAVLLEQLELLIQLAQEMSVYLAYIHVLLVVVPLLIVFHVLIQLI